MCWRRGRPENPPKSQRLALIDNIARLFLSRNQLIIVLKADATTSEGTAPKKLGPQFYCPTGSWQIERKNNLIIKPALKYRHSRAGGSPVATKDSRFRGHDGHREYKSWVYYFLAKTIETSKATPNCEGNFAAVLKSLPMPVVCRVTCSR